MAGKLRQQGCLARAGRAEQTNALAHTQGGHSINRRDARFEHFVHQGAIHGSDRTALHRGQCHALGIQGTPIDGAAQSIEHPAEQLCSHRHGKGVTERRDLGIGRDALDALQRREHRLAILDGNHLPHHLATTAALVRLANAAYLANG